MKLLKTITSTKLSDMSDKFPEVLKEIMETLDNLKSLRSVLKDTENPTQGDDILTELENFEESGQIEYYTLFAQLSCARDILSCARAKSALSELKDIFDFAEKALEKYIPLSKEECNQLLKIAERAIGHLTLFLKQQFNLEETLALLDTPDEAVDATFYGYIQSTPTLNLKTSIKDILDYSVECKPPLKVFEEYPELESDFLAIVGNTEDFEILEEFLTKPILDKVLACQNLAEVEQVIEELKAYAKSIQISPSNAF